MYGRIRVLLTGLCAVVLLLGLGSSPDAAIAAEDYTYANLSHRSFVGEDLVGASLAAADAREADFEGADLSQTILTKGSFYKAHMPRVNLTESFADRVVFDGADLTNAIVVDAIMTSTSFNEAVIEGADFSGTILDRYQISQMCKRASGTNPVTGVTTRDSLGCR
ncbi:pentapeptide repeat-containing protein [Oscillatoria sp. CS-180]|uniref:pentapeptide repeat-containing protein n=1 Tax=Oscillatoria sp. CS-180 TaxID=3021720 RepID=UPI00232FB5DA|nr:pentapeptide repeat-containing protein [Oscillatoria sp. CS-180]MDB9527803.1 pentapeptide repeat-containing protein [Oscillatoria sp. CS-180]